ncbi:transcriptional regulator family: Fungal Specific TF [Paecilomyces variotii]|nr:transcriptional regulator family: Fungal Specific TF [Paecilomyces variotii]
MSLMPTAADASNPPDQGVLSNKKEPLERVKDVLSENSSIDGRPDSGSMRLSDSELRYVGGDHWAAILDSIADLKEHFDREEQFRLSSSQPIQADDEISQTELRCRHALLLYGCRRSASRTDILSALPPKTAVDRYISRYFNRLDLYESFWDDPSGVPIAWIGLLFSMMCLAELASDASDSAPGHEAGQRRLQIDLYRETIVQCLLAAEYTRPGPYVLETMIHYVYVDFCLHTDEDKDLWFLLALEVNLAMRMGYHRDPSKFPGISPLQGEMRRRLWATVLMSDILISSQMGMPRMISDWQYDTAEPRNLDDTDLDEDTTELPLSRPETEHTAALGVIARRRMLIALGTVSDLAAAVQPCSYADVMRVDGILQEAAGRIPSPLRMKPMAASITDSPQVIMARLFIRHMFYKGQIILHRRFLFMKPPVEAENSFAYSHKVCLDASLGTLQIQHVLDEETCPGGQLHMMRWRVTSIMNHLFLTATMILCSLLHREQTLGRFEDIRSALRTARTIWMRRSSISREARMAAETVSIILAKTREGRRNDNDLDDTLPGRIVEEPSNMTNLSPAVCEANSSMGLDTERSLSQMTSFWTSDPYTMPGLLGTFRPLDRTSQDFSVDIQDLMEGNTAFNEWTQMNWSGMSS